MADFDEIVAGLIDEIEVPEVVNYQEMTTFQLMDALQKVRKDLMDRGVIIEPILPEDLDKQSIYYGLLFEVRRRDLG